MQVGTYHAHTRRYNMMIVIHLLCTCTKIEYVPSYQMTLKSSRQSNTGRGVVLWELRGCSFVGLWGWMCTYAVCSNPGVRIGKLMSQLAQEWKNGGQTAIISATQLNHPSKKLTNIVSRNDRLLFRRQNRNTCLKVYCHFLTTEFCFR